MSTARAWSLQQSTVDAAGTPVAARWPDADLHITATGPGGTVASLRLRPPIGLQRPRYWYRVGCAVHAAAELQLYRRQTTLLLCNDLTGACELLDLAMAPGAEAALQAVLQAALEVVDAHPPTQGATVIAELPGPRDEQGRSPFWQGLGRHFYGGDPREVQRQQGDAWCSHVAALLPRQPLYASFLPEAAQAALAQTPAALQPLRQALEAAGLRWRHHVRIDDAGAVLERP